MLSSKRTLHANPGGQSSHFLTSLLSVTLDHFALSLPTHKQVIVDACVAKHCSSSRDVAEEEGDMLLVADVVWMTASKGSLFHKFPYFLKLDVTCGVKSRGILFLTMNGKTSENESFKILRCFVPNEQVWIFCWLLPSTALPLLLGKDHERMQMIISDGGLQEIPQINNLINLLKTPVTLIPWKIPLLSSTT